MDQSEIRQLSIVTSNKNDTNLNAQETEAGNPSRTSPQASIPDVTGTFTPRPETQGRAPQSTDRWFDDQLNRLFNDVSSEPLPPDLASLVGKLRAQGSKPDDK